MFKLKEVDVKDKRGNLVISPGLKVRHKKSQFEYTVKKVVKGKDGDYIIMLSSPTKPRFKPNMPKKVISDVEPNLSIRYSPDKEESMSSYYEVPSGEKDSPEDLLAVPRKEFEKEYEVK